MLRHLPYNMEHESTRRKFLKQTLFGAVALSLSRLIPFDIAKGTPAVQGILKFFSPIEYLVIQTVGERIVGTTMSPAPSASPVNVALRADTFLSEESPENQEQFHQLLVVFNSTLFAFLFEFRFSSFLDMGPEDQESYLRSWMTSSLPFRRTAFQALKRLSLSMFYTDPHSWNEIGYTGMFLPWEREGKK